VSAVHVWAYANPGSGEPPVFVGAATYGGARPDVAAVFGSQFVNSAFSLTVVGLAPGRYQLVAHAYSTVAGGFNYWRAVTLSVDTALRLFIDSPSSATVEQPFALSGWAADLQAAAGTGIDQIDVWAYPSSSAAPIFLGQAKYGGARPDVAAVYGPQFLNSAFGLTVTNLRADTYRIVVFAHSPVYCLFVIAASILVTIPDAPVITVTSGGICGTILVGGYAINPAAASGTGVDAVHVYAYQPFSTDRAGSVIFVGSSYGRENWEAVAAYGERYRYSGFAVNMPATELTLWTFVAFARSTITGTFNNAAIHTTALTPCVPRRPPFPLF
jgi:hypothetical protein